MNALELTQRQRELLGNIAKAVHQYQQAIADASARLKHESEQIEQSRDKERQRIEEERQEKTKIDFASPPKDAKDESQREKTKQRLQQKIAARRSTITLPRYLTIKAVEEEINRTLSNKISYDDFFETRIGCTILFILLVSIFACLGGNLLDSMLDSAGAKFVGIGGGVGMIAAFVIAVPAWRSRGKAFVNQMALLHHLYERWLELVDEQAGAQRAEAQRRYEQAVAQAKGQMLAAAEQSRPEIAEFGALTEPVSPPWESEAWRQWEPGRLGPGAVRLGVFKMEV